MQVRTERAEGGKAHPRAVLSFREQLLPVTWDHCHTPATNLLVYFFERESEQVSMGEG